MLRSIRRNRASWPGCAVLLAVLSNACSSSSSSPTTPTPNSPLPQIAISDFSVTMTNAGAGFLYRTSYQVAETSGRANAFVTTVTFSFAGNSVTNASPTSPVRLAAGSSLLSGPLTITDTTGLTAGTTSVTLTIGYNDDVGRTSTVSSTASVIR